MEYQTLAQGFVNACAQFQKPAALRFKKDGAWRDISHAQVLDRVRALSLAMVELGIQKGDRVALLSENRPEWAMIDYATLCAAATLVPIYPTVLADQVHYILENSGARVLFVSSPQQLKKAIAERSKLPALEHIVLIDPAGDSVAGVKSLADIEKLGAGRDAKVFDERVASVKPEDLFTLIYTSGTTGMPKGVMLTHANMVHQGHMTPEVIPFGTEDTALSFLPLSHIFERMVDYALFFTGTTIAYAESIDAAAANLAEIRPTIMAAVPRLYEKLYERVLDMVRKGSKFRQRLFHWGVAVGKERTQRVHAKQPVGAWLSFKDAIARALIYKKVTARVGGNIRFFLSGGAPLAREIAEFFHAVGMPIYEGYGLTETSPVISVNTPENVRLGSVGKVIRGMQVKIAEDGEILVSGASVMQGYFKLEKETADCLKDGWFYTGDIGHLDNDGFLVITDRKKDLIKTSGGKYVAPQPIENALKMTTYISNAVIVGNGRKFISVLVVPNLPRLETYAKENGITYAAPAELLKNDRIRVLFDQEMDKMNANLASYESIKKYALVEKDFSIENGEITPTLKIKRKVVETRHKEVIDKMYDEPYERK